MNYPFIISSILITICFLVILILNLENKNKIINYSFMIISIVEIILIVFRDNSFIYEFLKAMITYIWYPNYLIFIIILLISIITFLITLIKERDKVNKILNYILFSICFSCYLIYLDLNIDVSLYSNLYSTKSLIILRIISITFIIWIIIKLILRIRGKKNEK